MTIAPPAIAAAPLALLLGDLGNPPGILADIGGTLTPVADELQRAGWILHTVAAEQHVIRHAARLGVRTALKASTEDLPLPDGRYSGVMLSLGNLAGAERALSEAVRIARPGVPVVVLVGFCESAGKLVEAMAAAGLTRMALHTIDGEPAGDVPLSGAPLVAVSRKA